LIGGQMPQTAETAMTPVGGEFSEPVMNIPDVAPSSQTAPQSSAARDTINELLADRASNAPWLALAKAGFATAAGNSPYALQNIGAGGVAGIDEYSRLMERNARDRLLAAQQALLQERADREAAQADRRLAQGDTEMEIKRGTLEENRRSRMENARIEREKLALKERELDEIDKPVSQARIAYMNANAANLPSKAEMQLSLQLDRIQDNARQEAQLAATNKSTGEFDQETYRRVRDDALRRGAKAIGKSPSIFGLVDAPNIDTIINGYKFKGGNPSRKSSWEKVGGR